jgi:glycosyltransferase involved in cell wall biosynthesis
MKPKVSVIIPAYNVLPYIMDTLVSVERQTFQDFEALVVDDGATDGTAAVIEEFCRDHPRFRLLSKQNGGLSSARNHGIRHAQADYIALLDADDMYAPKKLENHVAMLDADPAIGVVYSGSRIMRDDGQLTFMTMSGKPVHLDPLVALLFKNFIGHGSNGVFRRQLFDEVGSFDEGLPSCEDTDFWLRVAASERWRFERIRQNLVYYRVRPSGLSFNLARMERCNSEVIERARHLAPQKVEPVIATAYAYMYRFLARVALTANDQAAAESYMQRALHKDASIFWQDPRSLATLLAVRLGAVAQRTIRQVLN